LLERIEGAGQRALRLSGLITEMPDNVSAAAIALAFAAGGSLRNCQTTALMSNAESLEAMRKAATCGYKPVVAAASGAATRP